MQWLLTQAEHYRSHLRSGPFFQKLARVDKRSDLKWIHQLLHQSREFTQALCLRYSLCHDKRYQRMFAEHAFEESDHPDELVAWMVQHKFLVGSEAASLPATQETLNSLAFCWRAAVREPHDIQVVALNLLSEGIAVDFFAAVVPVLDRLGLLTGRYWRGHREIDERHLHMGLDIVGDVAVDSPQGMRYQRVLWHGAGLYHQMLSSWVGEEVQPLTALWTENTADLLLQPPNKSTVAQGTMRIKPVPKS